MDMIRPVQSDMSDLVARLGRHWWLAALCVLAGMGGAWANVSHQPQVYESATAVLVQPVGDHDANVVGGRTKGEINLDTEAQLVSSTPVATGAAALLNVSTAPTDLAAGVTVDVPANTSVLVITYAADSPRAAQAGSHAFAEAYLQSRHDTANADLTNQMNTVNAKLQELNAALARINAQLAGASPNSTARANLDSQRSTTISQINTLTGRMNQLSTTTVSAGRIIRDANLPDRPSKPHVPLNLASGAAAGLLLSVGLALLRERFDRGVRRPGDLLRRVDLPVLAALPRSVRPRLDLFPQFGAGGRIFNRLRNEVLASIPQQPLHVVVVTGASRGPTATIVAANLAAAFARTGSPTVLVNAQLPDGATDASPVARMFGVRTAPGLSDVLNGRTGLARAVQPVRRTPCLRVITTGSAGSAAGQLQSQALRDMLTALRQQAQYVVIEAPSTAASANAQSLASLADAAIVAVELRHTRYTQVTDAADQLRRVGTPVLGAVVLPRLRGIGRQRHTDAEPDEPPADLDTAGYDTAGYKTAEYGTAQYETAQYETAQYETAGQATAGAGRYTPMAGSGPRPQPARGAQPDGSPDAELPTVVFARTDAANRAGEADDDPDVDDQYANDPYVDDQYANDPDVDDDMISNHGADLGYDPRAAAADTSPGRRNANARTATGVLAALTEDGPLDGAR